jgi:hypothetical protein
MMKDTLSVKASSRKWKLAYISYSELLYVRQMEDLRLRRWSRSTIVFLQLCRTMKDSDIKFLCPDAIFPSAIISSCII